MIKARETNVLNIYEANFAIQTRICNPEIDMNVLKIPSFLVFINNLIQFIIKNSLQCLMK